MASPFGALCQQGAAVTAGAVAPAGRRTTGTASHAGGAVPVGVVVRAAARAGRRRSGQADLGAGLLQLGLRGLGGLLRHALQDRLRGGLDEVLGLLEAQARDELADDLDDLDLLLARGLEDDVE